MITDGRAQCPEEVPSSINQRMMSLTEQELVELREIKERWQNYKRKFCAGCLSEMIHIGDSHMLYCQEGRSEDSTDSEDSTEHANSGDADIIAFSGRDIWALIRIIETRAFQEK